MIALRAKLFLTCPNEPGESLACTELGKKSALRCANGLPHTRVYVFAADPFAGWLALGNGSTICLKPSALKRFQQARKP